MTSCSWLPVLGALGATHRLGIEVDVVDAGVALTGEEAGNPRVGVAESPYGEGDARGDREARLQHLLVLVGLGERREVVCRYLGRGSVYECPHFRLGDGDLQVK